MTYDKVIPVGSVVSYNNKWLAMLHRDKTSFLVVLSGGKEKYKEIDYLPVGNWPTKEGTGYKYSFIPKELL
jgi:hypothetical protein